MANIFPKTINKLPLQLVLFLAVCISVLTGAITYYCTPKYTRVGYQPVQPVPFSHAIHAGQLGIDCRYCHYNVEKSATSNIPDAATCMTCHDQIRSDSPALEAVRKSYKTGDPIPWVKVHEMPDYVYFAHAPHLNRGIACSCCHGPINQMDEVSHAKSFSMSFCLDCHRDPAQNIRPLDALYDTQWEKKDSDWQKNHTTEAQLKQGRALVAHWKVQPGQSCSVCHR